MTADTISRPMGPQKAAKLNATLTAEMALVLRANGADLEDERACMKLLTDQRFRSGDIVALVDDAIDEARRQNNAATDPEWAKDGSRGGR